MVVALLLPVVALLPLVAGGESGATGWVELEPGLELGTFPYDTPQDVSDGLIRVLRVSPEEFDIVVLSASGLPTGSLLPKEWAEAHDLRAVINSSMFDTDWSTSTGLLRADGHENNPKPNADNAFLVSRPVKGTGPARILDRQCDDTETELPRYRDVVQSIRMLSCKGENVWAPQPKRWSHAVTGQDADGRILLIHSRSPASTHDFIEQLRRLPLKLERLMYGDGGPPAQLYVRSAGKEYEFIGSYETGIQENDANLRSWRLPNIIGVRPRPADAKAAPPSATE